MPPTTHAPLLLAPLGPDKSPKNLNLLPTPSLSPLSDLAPSPLAIGWLWFEIQGISFMAPTSDVAMFHKKTYDDFNPS